MSLNIKNERTHALVRELATLTGVSQTQAVEDAVQKRLEELKTDRREGMAERLLALGREIAPSLKLDDDEDPTAFLYDENGIPK